MKKLFLLVGFLALTLTSVIAGPVDQQKAQQLGSRFLGTTAAAQRGADVQLNLVSVTFSRSGTDFYAFNVRGGNGFVIVAGDDRVKPILAYSTTGSYNPQDVSEGFAYMLNSYREEIHYVREHNLSATPDIIAEWDAVMESGQINPGRTARAVVGPLCQTIWNQNFPYNSQCPEDPEGSGGYVYAGCVATAMGQAMKFWDYPERGTGSHTYYPEGYASQTANFGETDYHFELMPLALDSTSTEEDYFYIAQFLHHCGIAVDMQYSGHGSGAYSFDVITALNNYFGYTCDDDLPTLSFWGFNWYTNEQWAQMLKDGGLDENLPLYYSGSDDNGAGGHAFVCDGYDENDYFHFNWGWSGRDDAWCPIGALNTTKYAFNDSNSFLGHIIPANSSYYQRADSVAEFIVYENGNFDGVMLSWENPSLNLNGQPLSAIDSIVIRRNNQPLVTLMDVQKGETMSYEDSGLEPGLYEYSISVCNSAGVSRMAYRTIMVGEKCPVTFVLQDAGGDGWKGAAISVTNESGQRIAVIGMDEGSVDTLEVPLLKSNLNFIWNHGWYHTTEQYDTDDECSFFIFDGDNNMLYSSEELEDGVFLTYNNNCEFGTLSCYPVQNLQGEYQWHNEEEYGAYLTWKKPSVSVGLDHFTIYRANYNGFLDVLATVPYDGYMTFEYFDNLEGQELGGYIYLVSATFVNWEQQCESDKLPVDVTVTYIQENSTAINVYPNPTDGVITVEGVGHLTVINTLGQTVKELELDGRTTMELPRGVFFAKINGITKKVVVE